MNLDLTHVEAGDILFALTVTAEAIRANPNAHNAAYYDQLARRINAQLEALGFSYNWELTREAAQNVVNG